MQALERIVTMYLDYAEYQASRHIPMTMQDWSQRLNRFLEFNEHEILHDTGRVTHEIAKAFAESEFEKYRVVQDRLFESDFDRFLTLEKEAERHNNEESLSPFPVTFKPTLEPLLCPVSKSSPHASQAFYCVATFLNQPLKASL